MHVIALQEQVKHALDLMQDELHTCADVTLHLCEIIIL